MPASTVIVSRCLNYDRPEISDCLAKQFELVGGIEKFVKRGDSVLLKPNLLAPRPSQYAVQTDPAVILEVARILKDFGAKPFVGDSPGWGNVFHNLKALELDEPLRKLGVPVKQLNKPKFCRIGKRNTLVGISSVAMDADVIINLPKFKSHQQLVATFAVKNMFGCISGKQKALWHFRKGKNHSDFCELLIDIYSYLKPAFTIIDAVVAMDGPGPIRGRARPLGWLIGGTDPVACEVICAELVDINPAIVPMITTAKILNFGCADRSEIAVIGDDYSSEICRDFIPAKQIPLRFSFPQVCKSIFKQISFLTRSKIVKQ
jgi:uncharacterized protein (DUF362 family)